jgi:uncharacterized protein
VPTSSVIGFCEALGAVGVERRSGAYWAARATLVHRPEDLAIFDRCFDAFWQSPPNDPSPVEPERIAVSLAVDDGDEQADNDVSAGQPSEEPTIMLRFSAAEVLRNKDFSSYDDGELRHAQQLMRRLRLAGPPRSSFRLQPSTRGSRPDVRATVRASLRSGGEPIRRHWRQPGPRMRRLVLLIDISGSMEPYARAMLRFVHAAVAGRQRVEAFAIATRLTRMTKELQSRDPDTALAAAARRVQDWSGGTRLGECLRTFNDAWGVRGMARGAIVVVLSDGWDRGDPALLAEQMQRLQRVSYSTIWVNPLKVTPGYAPLARGMAAAMPYVDHFMEGHSIAAMEQLATIISTPVG